MYCKLIEDTVKELRGQKIEVYKEADIDFKIKGFIPKYYISDLNQRLEFYRRLYLANDLEMVKSLEEELIDRFGSLPDASEKLIKLLEVKILCQKLSILQVKSKADGIYFEFDKENKIPAKTVVSMLDENLKFDSEYRLKLMPSQNGWKEDLLLFKDYLIKLEDAFVQK